MQVSIARFTEQGQYTGISKADKELLHLETGLYFIGEVDPETQYHDVVTNTPKQKGNRPTPEHVFNYKTKQWHDPRTVEQKEIGRINKIKATRAAEYPNIGEQLDALWKAIASNPKGLPIETTDMLASVQAVKARHPK